MKTRLLALYAYIFAIPFVSNSQNDEFMIGMFGVQYKSLIIENCEVTYQVPIDSGFKTSTLNVFKEDGLNIVNIYAPNLWTEIAEIKTF